MLQCLLRPQSSLVYSDAYLPASLGVPDFFAIFFLPEGRELGIMLQSVAWSLPFTPPAPPPTQDLILPAPSYQCLAPSLFLLAFVSLHLEIPWLDLESPLLHSHVCLLSLKSHLFTMIWSVISVWPGRGQAHQMDDINNHHIFHIWSILVLSFCLHTHIHIFNLQYDTLQIYEKIISTIAFCIFCTCLISSIFGSFLNFFFQVGSEVVNSVPICLK